jgi:methylase of polypeptide subunit release factors
MPKQVMVVDDSFSANRYTSLASQGVSFIWKGDFQNAKLLLQAVQRRITKKDPVPLDADPATMAKEFYRHRQHQAYRAQLLGRLMVLVEADLTIQLPKSPDLRQAISEAIQPPAEGFLISLRELLGFNGAHEWRKKGVSVAALGGKKIHAYYGVFSPVRGEYLDLIANAPLPQKHQIAFDIGTGTGVISAILAERGFQNVIATEIDSRAFNCANENILNLGLENKVKILKADLFPEGKADLIVCNPPWLPTKPTSAIEHAVYDDGSVMLKSFLAKAGLHLQEQGEVWLIISDLAEHLGLRGPQDLEKWIAESNLKIIDVLKTKPKHGKATDEEDFLHAARSKEVTKLWRLKRRFP